MPGDALNVTTSTLSLTVADVDASRVFFCTHLGYEVAMAADGFASLTRGDAAADIVLLRRGTEVLPADQRDREAAWPDPGAHGHRTRRRGTAAAW